MFLAHGALGAFDEIIFFAIAAIFLVMMGISWFMSRNNELDVDDETQPNAENAEHVTLD